MLALAFVGAGLQPLRAQDPCDAKKNYEDAQAEAKKAGHSIPKPVPPLGVNGSPLNKASLQTALQRANDARSKAEKTKNDDETALRDASAALTKFNGDSQRGRRLAMLKGEITTLEGQIKKAQDANSKVSREDRLKVINFRRDEVEPLQQRIVAQMPGVPLDGASDKVDDPSYEGFRNSEIDALRQEIKRNQDLIKRIEDKYANLSATPTASDDEQIEKARRAIAEAEAKLKQEIEKCRNNVRADLSSLRRKQSEYDSLLANLYPDQETRDLVAALPQLQVDLRTKTQEQKTLSDEQKKLHDAENQAREKLDGGTKNGQPFTGSRKAFENADQQVKIIEGNLKKVADYETKDAAYTAAEKKKTDAEQKVTDATADYNNAVTTKDTALSQAKTAAALGTLDARLKTVNKALVDQAKAAILGDPEVVQVKERLSARLKASQNEPDKEKLRLQWKAFVTRRVRPHYIRLRNQAEADRLRAILDTLQPFKCFDDVNLFINDLNTAINDVLARTASLASDMDPGAGAGADDERIPVEPVPPLDEGGREAEFKALTDKVEQATTNCDYKEAARLIGEISRMTPREQYMADWLQTNLPKLAELQNRERDAIDLIKQADASAGLAEAESLKDAADWNSVSRLAQQAMTTLTQADREAPKCLAERQQMEQIRRRLAELVKRKRPEIAASIVLLVDTSGSMAENNKINQAKDAAKRAARQVSKTTEIAILNFDGGCGAGAMRVAADFTTDLSSLIAAIDRLQPGGGTPMYIASAEAVAHAQKNGRGKNRTVVLMSDGGDSCRDQQAKAADSIRSSNIPVSTIGFDVGNNQQAQGDLGNLATMTGGRTFSASAADPREIIRAFNLAMLPSLLKDLDFGSAGANLAGYFSQAKSLVQQQDIGGALMMLQQANQLAPNSPNLNFNLSLLYEADDQLIPAMNHANNYLRLAPGAVDRADVENRIGQIQQELQKNPRTVFDTSGCRDVLSWAQTERDAARRSGNAARVQAALEILIAAQRGDCDKARPLVDAYKGRYR